MTRLYVAGPLFNTHERWYLEQIAAQLDAAGYKTFLPHRDVGLMQDGVPREQLFKGDVTALEACDGCVALLTGADQDSGTSVELGFMYARNKPCFGITDDMRWLNNMIWGVCSEGQRIARTPDELVKLVDEVFTSQHTAEDQ